MKILFLSFFLFTFQAQADVVYQIQQNIQNSTQKAGIPIPPVKPGIFQQKIDHFSTSDVRVFNQRYWSANLYGKKSNSPVILYICGESTCGPGAIGIVLSNLARGLGASIYALEHRYYGKSQPFEDLKTENLAHLKTDQVLQDLVDFKIFIQQKMKLTGPWIIVGGSYAGALAAYSRQQHPEHFEGALASSAAVRPDSNFDEYDVHVGKMAGEDCVQNLQKVLSDIEFEIKTQAGFLQMKQRFGSQLQRTDDFLQLLSDIASASIQLGQKKEFCEAMKEKGIEGYVQMKQKVDATYGEFEKYSAEAAENPSLTAPSANLGMRQWFYQSCTEYGMMQTASTEAKFRARSLQINTDYQDRICQRLFGLPSTASVEHVTQKYYVPLLETNTSKILFTGGDKDPWSSTAISPLNQNNSNPNTESLLLKDGGHCSDLMSAGSEAVMAAKSRFASLAKSWVAGK